MKKLLALLLCLALCAGLCACGAEPAAPVEEPEAEETEVVNPITEYKSLEEINSAAGTELRSPAVMGLSDESFCTISGAEGEALIAQYCFNIYDISYCFRAAARSEDISGVYVGESTLFAKADNELSYASAGGTKYARWFDEDVQYVLGAEDKGVMLDETFESIVAGLMPVDDTAFLEEFYESLVGSYIDNISQRATAEITRSEAGGVHIVVTWSDSAFLTNEWVMDAAVEDDGMLHYHNCTYTTTEFSNPEEASESADETGNAEGTQSPEGDAEAASAEATEGDTALDPEPVVTVVYENGEGYFVDVNTWLNWIGAADEMCRDCAFAPVE